MAAARAPAGHPESATADAAALQEIERFSDALWMEHGLSENTLAAYRNDHTGGSKVTLKAKNANQLIRAYREALEAGLPCALIVDQHHVMPPHFTGEPVITAVGIGPCTKAQARSITKRFNCL